MLTVKEGDLFKHAKARCLIAHGCNAQGVMGSGVALEIKTRFPGAYESYKLAHDNGRNKLGQIIYAHHDGIIIANCITQEFFGRDKNELYVSYSAVDKCMNELASFILYFEKNLPVHLPFIGGGLANGSREKLMQIFEQAFQKTDATLWIKS